MTAPLIHDPAVHKLGRRPRVPTLASHLARTRFAALVASLPPPPSSVDRSALLANCGVMLNNQLGDCTCAAKGHIIQLWTAANGNEITVSDGVILAAYEGACGYNPLDPSTDQGGNMDTVAAYFRDTGIGGYKADAFVIIDPRNRDHVKHAINRYGACDLGLSLPTNAQAQAVWDLAAGDGKAADPGSWGGHDAVAVGYDDAGVLIETWGMIKRATWIWFDAYTDEAFAYWSRALWAPTGTAPCGVSAAELDAELSAVAA